MKRVAIDFGTYHHTTPKESNAIRKRAGKAFSKLLRSLYPSRAPLRILDAGCGLGFLMYVAAKRFPKARITGVDLFRRGSMSQISIEKAANNIGMLGIASRTSLVKHDLTKPIKADEPYDLAVSNLVFHNMGEKRFRGVRDSFQSAQTRRVFRHR
jgi:tRNA1(Val) A37 N6-methylase TrmN6